MRNVGPEWGTGRNSAKKEDPHMHAGEFNEHTHSSGGGGDSSCYVAVTTLSTQLLTAQLLSSPSPGHSVMEAP